MRKHKTIILAVSLFLLIGSIVGIGFFAQRPFEPPQNSACNPNSSPEDLAFCRKQQEAEFQRLQDKHNSEMQTARIAQYTSIVTAVVSVVTALTTIILNFQKESKKKED